MKNVIVFVASFKTQHEIPKAKKEIREYLGSRMIEDVFVGEPAMQLNTVLNEKDLKRIDEILESHKGVRSFIANVSDDDNIEDDYNNILRIEPIANEEKEI